MKVNLVVVRGQPQGWQQIELFGRRHVTEEVPADSPYETAKTSEKIFVSGGPLQVARVKDLGADGLEALAKKWLGSPASSQIGCFGSTPAEVRGKYDELAKADAIALEGVALTGLFQPQK